MYLQTVSQFYALVYNDNNEPKTYTNSENGRNELLNEVTNEIYNSIISVWGNSALVYYKYGKFENGAFVAAPNFLVIDGISVFTPNYFQYISYGYYPVSVDASTYQEPDSTHKLIDHYAFNEDQTKIIQTFELVPKIPSDYPPPTIQQKLDTLTAAFMIEQSINHYYRTEAAQ